jgi:hypothetical protein
VHDGGSRRGENEKVLALIRSPRNGTWRILHEISKTPLLDAAQEVDLSKAIG